MAESNEDRRSSARKRAQNHFQASEQRDVLVRQIIDKQRAATDAKIAKLRALRLAKEAADREAATLSGADSQETAPKPRARKKRITAG
ncbi:MAG: hypothetical protein ACT4OG_03840 [Alphaproteobacteria bacterium]